MNVGIGATQSDRPAQHALALLFAIWALGSGIDAATGITGLDEYWHSMRTAMQSFEAGSWWLPLLDGEVRVEKPPLLYWLMMASFSAFDVTFWAARLPSLLLGVTFAYLVATLYADFFRRDRLLPFLITVSLLTIAVESRRAMLDLPVGVCTVAAVVSWFRQQRDPKCYWWLITALAVSAGFYFKGPVALWFIATGVSALHLAIGQPKGITPILGVTTVTSLLIGIWVFTLSTSSPDWFSRLTEDSGDRDLDWPDLKSIRTVTTGLIVTSLPWLFAALSARPAMAIEAKDRATLRSLWLWIAIAIIPFLFIRTFERYLLPLSIPLALLATYVLHGCEISRRRQLLSAVVLTAIPVLIVTALTVWLSTSSLTIILTALISVLLLTAFTLAWRRETIATTVSLITATAVVLAYLYPQLGVNRLPEVVLADFRDGSGAHYASPYPGTLSMALGRSVPIIERENRNSLQSHALVNGRLILRRDDLATLRQSALALDIDVTIEKRFSMWYSRGSFLSLSKPGMSGEERWRAIVARQVSSLQPEFVTARVSMRTAQ